MSLHAKATEYGIVSSSREENEKLFRKILDGKRAAKRLVEGNMAYVVSKVKSFLYEYTGFEFLRDDLISEGFLVLTRIAENVAQNGEMNEEDFSPQGMISVSLRNAWINMIRVEREIPLTDAIAETHIHSEADVVDLKLDILSCCENDRERQVVEYRCQGLGDENIGAMFGVTKARIGQIRNKIFERFQKKPDSSGSSDAQRP